MGIHPEAIHDIRRGLDVLPRGEMRAYMEAHAASLGVSVPTLYREIRKAPSAAQKKKRADAGTSRTFTPKELEAVSAIRRKVGGIAAEGYSFENALRDAVEDGLVETKASVVTLRRQARSAGVENDRRPVRRLRADRPNHVHQFDVTGADYFAVERCPKTGEPLLRVRAKQEVPYKNREGDLRESLWLYALIDMHSRYFFGDLFIAPGEDGRTGCAFLAGAWGKKEGEEFGGIPEIVYTDNGPFGGSELGAVFCRAFSVRLIAHAPYNPRAKGMVERAFKTVRGGFQARYLRHRGALIPLDEVRAAFHAYRSEYNGKRVPSLKASRGNAWFDGADRNRLRWAPENALEFAFRQESRTVRRDSTISFEGQTFLVPDADLIGERVSVFYNVDGVVMVQHGEATHRAEPFEETPFEEFHTQARIPASVRRLDAAENALPAPASLPSFGGRAAEAAPQNVRRFPINAPEAEPEIPFAAPSGHASTDAALEYLNNSLTVPVWKIAAVDALRVRLAADLSRAAVDHIRDELIDTQNAKEALS